MRRLPGGLALLLASLFPPPTATLADERLLALGCADLRGGNVAAELLIHKLNGTAWQHPRGGGGPGGGVLVQALSELTSPARSVCAAASAFAAAAYASANGLGYLQTHSSFGAYGRGGAHELAELSDRLREGAFTHALWVEGRVLPLHPPLPGAAPCEDMLRAAPPFPLVVDASSAGAAPAAVLLALGSDDAASRAAAAAQDAANEEAEAQRRRRTVRGAATEDHRPPAPEPTRVDSAAAATLRRTEREAAARGDAPLGVLLARMLDHGDLEPSAAHLAAPCVASRADADRGALWFDRTQTQLADLADEPEVVWCRVAQAAAASLCEGDGGGPGRLSARLLGAYLDGTWEALDEEQHDAAESEPARRRAGAALQRTLLAAKRLLALEAADAGLAPAAVGHLRRAKTAALHTGDLGAVVRSCAALARLGGGTADEAIDYLEEASVYSERHVAMARHADEATGRSVLHGQVLAELGMAYYKQDRLDEALASLGDALETEERALGRADRAVGDTLYNLGLVRAAAGDRAGALAAVTRAAEIAYDALGADAPATVERRDRARRLRKQLGKLADADFDTNIGAHLGRAAAAAAAGDLAAAAREVCLGATLDPRNATGNLRFDNLSTADLDRAAPLLFGAAPGSGGARGNGCASAIDAGETLSAVVDALRARARAHDAAGQARRVLPAAAAMHRAAALLAALPVAFPARPGETSDQVLEAMGGGTAEAVVAHSQAMADTFRGLEGGLRKGVRASPRVPVFIVGSPRAGVALLERALQTHTKVVGVGPFPALAVASLDLAQAAKDSPTAQGNAVYHVKYAPGAADELGAVYADAWDTLFDLAGVSRKSKKLASLTHQVDAEPHNWLWLWLSQVMFPEALVFHVTREPTDHALSAYKEGVARLPYARGLSNISAVLTAERAVMDMWRDVLDVPIHEVRYEDLVRTPERTLRKVLGVMGLDLQADMVESFDTLPRKLGGYAVPEAAHFARGPGAKTAFHGKSSGRWRRYFAEAAKEAEAEAGHNKAARESEGPAAAGAARSLDPPEAAEPLAPEGGPGDEKAAAGDQEGGAGDRHHHHTAFDDSPTPKLVVLARARGLATDHLGRKDLIAALMHSEERHHQGEGGGKAKVRSDRRDHGHEAIGKPSKRKRRNKKKNAGSISRQEL